MLRQKPFLFYWCARVLTSLAYQGVGVAVGWQIYELTGSAWYLGLVGLAQFLPLFSLTLVVGQVADRFDRRIIASICQFAQACAQGCLHGAVSPGGRAKNPF